MAVRYAYCLADGNLAPLHHLPSGVRNTALCALSSLAKYLGIHDYFAMLVRRHRLKWKDVRVEDLILSRIARAGGGGDVVEWVRRVKGEVPRLGAFMDFVTLTGLRLEEAVNSYNLIIELGSEGRLGEYYSYEGCMLEHFRFRELFMRRTKKVFISIVPGEVVEAVRRAGERLTVYKVNNWVRRDRRLGARFNDVREYWATYMTRWLNPAEIDFLQGRVSGTVFMRNYFNPALITDLKDRVLRGVTELQGRLRNSESSGGA
jgi:hypothetical protein